MAFSDINTSGIVELPAPAPRQRYMRPRWPSSVSYAASFHALNSSVNIAVIRFWENAASSELLN